MQASSVGADGPVDSAFCDGRDRMHRWTGMIYDGARDFPVQKRLLEKERGRKVRGPRRALESEGRRLNSVTVIGHGRLAAGCKFFLSVGVSHRPSLFQGAEWNSLSVHFFFFEKRFPPRPLHLGSRG